MAIEIKVKCDTEEKRDEIRDTFCRALVGSPAFINSEIAVCDDEADSFILAVGNLNDNNISLDLEYSSLNIKPIE